MTSRVANESRPGGEIAARLRVLAGSLDGLSFVPGTSAERREYKVLSNAKRMLEAKLLVELERAFAPPLVALVCGGTNVGKSTLFNAILQEELSSVDPRAAHTMVPVAKGPLGSQEVLKRLLVGCEVHPAKAPAGAGRLGQTSGNIVLLSEGGGVQDVILIDSPDIDSTSLEHHERARKLLIASDLVVFVTSPTKYNDKRCVEFLIEAGAMGKRLLILFNLLPEPSAGSRKEVLEDFRREVLTRLPAEAGPPPVFEFDISPPGAAGRLREAAKAVRASLETYALQAKNIKKAVASSGARHIVGSMKAVLRALREQASSLQFIQEALDKTGRRAAEEYEAYLRGLEFLDLELVLARLLKRFRVPVLDDVLDMASELPKKLLWNVLRRPSFDDRRREQAAAMTRKELELISRARLEFAQQLEGNSTDEVVGKLYRELITPEYYAMDLAAAWTAKSDSRATVLDAWLRAFEGEMIAKLERSGALRRALKAVRALLELGSGVAAAVLTGGVGLGDLIWAPLATKSAQLIVERIGREYFRSKRDEYIELARSTFEDSLDEVLLGPLRDRVPSAPRTADIDAVEQELRWLGGAFPLPQED